MAMDSNYAKSISLPTRESFRNLENAKRFAIDIGERFHNYNGIALFLYSSKEISRGMVNAFEYDASESPDLSKLGLGFHFLANRTLSALINIFITR